MIDTFNKVVFRSYRIFIYLFDLLDRYLVYILWAGVACGLGIRMVNKIDSFFVFRRFIIR